MRRRTFAEWLNDMRWAMNAQRARRIRRELPFSRRLIFDKELRPRRGDVPVPIAYPDAIYMISIEDLTRAMLCAQFPEAIDKIRNDQNDNQDS